MRHLWVGVLEIDHDIPTQRNDDRARAAVEPVEIPVAVVGGTASRYADRHPFTRFLYGQPLCRISGSALDFIGGWEPITRTSRDQAKNPQERGNPSKVAEWRHAYPRRRMPDQILGNGREKADFGADCQGKRKRLDLTRPPLCDSSACSIGLFWSGRLTPTAIEGTTVLNHPPKVVRGPKITLYLCPRGRPQ